MRNSFAAAVSDCAKDLSAIFLTGDLGFMALESVRDAYGERFINCGVAEQNMVTVASGLAREGFRPWVYSIAPFVYARPFEQVRNDVCLHDLPVRLVGNGGGYGYGPQGPTHHALEDCCVMNALPGMRVYAPAFAEDLAAITQILHEADWPAYLRLGRDEKPEGYTPPPYSGWRRLREGPGPVLCVLGPMAGPAILAAQATPLETRPEVWLCTEFPVTLDSMPDELLASLARTGKLCVAEEHVAQGGLGAELARILLGSEIQVRSFRHLYARGYTKGVYGSQAFHRRENNLDPESMALAISELAAQ